MSDPLVEIPVELRAAYEQCAQVVKRRARNFYYGLRLTPEPRRSAIYSVYAWMRQADDEADAAGSADEKRARLARFRSDTERLLAGGDAAPREGDFAFEAFAHTIRRFALDPADLRALLDGLDFDLEHEALAARLQPGAAPADMCASRDDLRTYCFRVASTVGLVCIRIWGLAEGAQWDHARPLAIRRGIAFQMTNILRDYAQDYDEGRVYLPAEDFRMHGLTPSDLRHWAKPRACEAMVRDLCSAARAEYLASAPLDRMVDPSCYATLRTMTRIYSGLLDVVEREPARIAGERRIRLQSARKAGIALRACARAWLNTHIPVLAARRG